MAKLIKTFESGIERTEVQFLGESFVLTMIPTNYGAHSVEDSLDVQLKRKFDNMQEDILDVFDGFSYNSGNDILEDLAILDEYENEVGYHAD